MSSFEIVPADMADRGFGVGFKGNKVPAYKGVENSPWAIPIDPNYVFDNVDVMRIMVQTWIREINRPDSRHRKGVYLHGPTGSGKTSTPEQFFARLGVPLLRTTWSPKREADDMVSSKTIVDGDLLPVDQCIAIAARNGFPVLINEIDLADPGELMPLNDIIEKGLITLADGSTFQAKRGFLVFVTGNTAGSDDEDGIYHGTRSQNIAFTRRFFSVKMDYPALAQEKSFLQSIFPDLSADVVEASAKVVVKIRQAFEGTADKLRLSAPISRPEAVDWIELMGNFRYLSQQGKNVAAYAMGFAFSNRLNLADQKVVEQIVANHFSPSTST